MRKLKVGFLMPYSGIYPYYGQHLMAGMQLALRSGLTGHPSSVGGEQVQFVPVFTKNGDTKTLINAVEQLLFFEKVDLLSGLISYGTLPEVIPIIDRYQKPAIFFDSGEYVPGLDVRSPYVFLASQQIWQTEYSLGRWAGDKFRNTGLIVMPFYEAGYHLHSSFWEGVQAAGGDSVKMHTISKQKSHGRVLDLTDFFKTIEQDKPAFVHGIFTGDQGTDFIRQWIQSAYNHKIPLLLVENMAYDDLLDDVSTLDFSFYAASSWSRSDPRPENLRFVQDFERGGGQKANIFALLGYEAGLFIRDIKASVLLGDTHQALGLLRTHLIQGPRGSRNFDPQRVQSMPRVDIEHINLNQRNIHKLVVDQTDRCLFSLERMQLLQQQSVSGWQNPYFCI